MRKGFLSALSPKAKRRIIGLAQDVLILALTVSAVLLAGGGGLLGLTDGLSAGVLGTQTEQGYGQQQGYTAAAEPLSMMLTPEAGAHCGIMYSEDELSDAYERYSATLAEALGSSGEPQEISEQEWRAALGETGVFFDFYCDFQLSSLAIWLGTDISGSAAGHTARRICIYLDEGQVWLSYIRSRADVLGIPLAAGVFIPLLHWQMNPMYGAAAMSLSSFCVVSNALRLNLFDIRSTKHDHKRKAHKTSKKENTTMNKTIKIEGMMCGHCEATVKKALEALDGVSAAEVSHTAGTAVVTLDKPVDDTVLKKAVEDKDYTVTGIE